MSVHKWQLPAQPGKPFFSGETALVFALAIVYMAIEIAVLKWWLG